TTSHTVLSTNATAGYETTNTYSFVVSNSAGPSDAQNVSFSDTWPAGFTRGTLPAGCANIGAGPDFSCSLGTIAKGGSASKSISYTVPSGTTASPQVNSATVSSSTSDPNPGNNTATDSNTVSTSADLKVTKSAPASATAGNDI